MIKKTGKAVFASLMTTLLFNGAVFAQTVEYVPDMQGSEIENWECSEGTVLSGGVLTNSWSSSTTMNITAIENVYSFKENYTYSATVYNEGGQDANTVLMVFNYRNDRNFYFVSIGGAGTVELGKRISGNDTVVEKYEESYAMKKDSPVKLTIDVSGAQINVTAEKNSEETVLFNNVTIDAIPDGKIGFKTSNCVMGVSDISVSGEADKCLLGLSESNITDGETGVSFNPEFNLSFDLVLDKDTVNKTNIGVECNGQRLSDELYSVEFDGESTVKISFTELLLPKTDYKIVISSGLHSLEYGSGFAKDYVINFTTKPQIFELTTAQLLVRGANVGNISQYSGQNAIIRVKVLNNEMTNPQPYMVALAVFDKSADETDKLMAIKIFSGEAVLGEEKSNTGSFLIPAGLTEDAYYKWFVWESLSQNKQLHFAQPEYFEATDFIKTDVDIASGKVTISGVLPNNLAKRAMTVLVLNPQNEEETERTVQHMAEFVTDADGKFTYSFCMSETAGAISGTYDIYVCGDDFKAPVLSNCYYALPSDRLNAIIDINKGEEPHASMEKKIEDYKDILGYNTEVYQKIDTSYLAARVLRYVSESQFDTADEMTVQNFMRREAILTAWEEGKTELVSDSDGNILFTELLGLDTLDEDEEITVTEFYNNKMTKDGKAKVISSLSGKELADSEDFAEKFAEYTVIYGVGNCLTDGYGHVEQLLRSNSEYVGINLDKYVPGRADRQLVTKKINTLEELQGYIDSLSKEPETSKPGGGSSGGSGGGGVSVKPVVSKPSMPVIEKPVAEAIEKSSTADMLFVDMKEFDWAKQPVEVLAQMDIISKPEDKMFRPADKVTRQEFTKLIVAAMGMATAEEDSIFSDVSDWAVPYINAAYNSGVVNGITETEFGGNNNITRQDAVVIIVRAFGFKDENGENPEFTDADKIADYAAESVKIAAAMEIVSGYDGAFYPIDGCTRAQAAKMIYNALVLGGKVN